MEHENERLRAIESRVRKLEDETIALWLVIAGLLIFIFVLAVKVKDMRIH